jgi:hypothetical protein
MRTVLICGLVAPGLLLGTTGPSGCWWGGREEVSTRPAEPPAAPTEPLVGTSGDPATTATKTGNEKGYVDPLVPPLDLYGTGRSAPLPENIPRLATAGTDPSAQAVLFPQNPHLFDPDWTADDRASFHAHGTANCASGCGPHNHPTPLLTEAEYRRLLAEFAVGSMDESNPALEALLHYNRQTTALIRQVGTKPLDPQRAALLRRELSRDHALWYFRVVDEAGTVRAEMKDMRVPLDRRHVFDMEVRNLQPLITSGTVKRVGLHHLWTRI